MKKLLVLLLLFFALFNFKVPLISNSLFLCITLSSLFYLKNGLNNKYTLTLLKLINNRFVKKIFLMYVFLLLYSFSWTAINNVFDFSLIRLNLLAFFFIIAATLITPLILPLIKPYQDKNYLNETCKILILLFCVQSIIQITGFIYTPFADFIHNFYPESILEKEYRGIRALALTSNPFFSLSSAYGLIFCLFFYLLSQKAISNSIIFFVLLLFGSFFAGRTAFIGFAFGLLIFLLCNRLNYFRSLTKLVVFTILIFAATFFIYSYILPLGIKSLVDDDLLPFAFEFIYNYQETGSFTTNSSDTLVEKHYFHIDPITFIYGEGRYVNNDGSFFMHTDAGYMRNILYYGIFGLIILAFFQINILISQIRYTKNKKEKFFFVMVTIYLFTLHYKGDVLMVLPIIQSIIYILTLTQLFQKKIIK